MGSFIQNLEAEKADGNFYAIADKPRSIREWVQEVRKVRQLDQREISDGMLEAKLKSFATSKRDFEPMRTQNKGLTAGMYKCMFLGVLITDYSLYHNVSDEFHSLLITAVQTTKREVQLTKSQLVNDIITAGSLAFIEKGGGAVLLLSFIKYLTAGLRWKDRIKDYGEWDYKRQPSTSFGKHGMNRGEYSRFFYYTGIQGKGYSHGYNKQGLMRNDDPGNLIYAATGAEILRFIGDEDFKKTLIKGFSDSYAAGHGADIAQKMRDGVEKGWEAGTFDASNIDVALFDDAHDIAVINWAYNTFADATLKNMMAPLAVRKALKFLEKKDK